ncbi:TetR/AcrR family transcriptional regulator [Novosphingobium umbonatum]|nr:TetR/AcrR family transcriptional regulator [Novosphingobium umbonatum]
MSKENVTKLGATRGSAQVTARILDAAQAEFMAVGYERANTNRIAADYGISKATIFRHYRSKLELFEAVVQRIAMRWDQDLMIEDAASLSPEAWLCQFAQAALRWVLSREALFVGRMAIAEGAVLQDIRDVWPRFATQPILATLSAQFAIWQEQGLLAPMDSGNLAQAFLDLLLAGRVTRAMYAYDLATDFPVEDKEVAFCVRLFLKGCAA